MADYLKGHIDGIKNNGEEMVFSISLIKIWKYYWICKSVREKEIFDYAHISSFGVISGAGKSKHHLLWDLKAYKIIRISEK